MGGGRGTVVKCDESCILNGNDCGGMTDLQYKGMLLDQLNDWQDILELAVRADNSEIQKVVKRKIAKINEKLRF